MVETVRSFFTNWDIYKLCIEHNTLFHREVGTILRARLRARTAPFTFLDLACGDATLTAAALRGTAVRSFTGVDFSAPALALAKENTRELGCPCEFLEADFAGYLRKATGAFDVIYLGLSLHHFERAEKRDLVRQIFRITAPGGEFYLYEPILHGGESREECLARWKRLMDTRYRDFPQAARDALWEHVSTADRPETVADYIASAKDAGFSGGEVLFTDCENTYSLMSFSR